MVKEKLELLREKNIVIELNFLIISLHNWMKNDKNFR